MFARLFFNFVASVRNIVPLPSFLGQIFLVQYFFSFHWLYGLILYGFKEILYNTGKKHDEPNKDFINFSLFVNKLHFYY